MSNTKSFILSSKVAALFVEDILINSVFDCQSITITKQEKLGGFSVSIVIDTLLEDIDLTVERSYSKALGTIYPRNTQAG